MNADVLTWEEIERRYPDEWVLIANPEIVDGLNVRAGRVVGHGMSQDEMDRSAQAMGLKDTAVLFTGSLFDEGVAYVL